jgi:hypothetical protein
MAEPMSTAEVVSLQADDPSPIDAGVGVLQDAVGAAAGFAAALSAGAVQPGLIMASDDTAASVRIAQTRAFTPAD